MQIVIVESKGKTPQRLIEELYAVPPAVILQLKVSSSDNRTTADWKQILLALPHQVQVQLFFEGRVCNGFYQATKKIIQEKGENAQRFSWFFLEIIQHSFLWEQSNSSPDDFPKNYQTRILQAIQEIHHTAPARLTELILFLDMQHDLSRVSPEERKELRTMAVALLLMAAATDESIFKSLLFFDRLLKLKISLDNEPRQKIMLGNVEGTHAQSTDVKKPEFLNAYIEALKFIINQWNEILDEALIVSVFTKTFSFLPEDSWKPENPWATMIQVLGAVLLEKIQKPESLNLSLPETSWVSFMRVLGDENIQKLIPNYYRLIYLLNHLPESSWSTLIKALEPNSIRRLIPNLKILSIVFNQYSGDALRALIGALGSEFIQEYIENGFALGFILKSVPESSYDVILQALGDIQKILPWCENLEQALFELHNVSTRSSLIRALGSRSLKKIIQNSEQLRKILGLLQADFRVTFIEMLDIAYIREAIHNGYELAQLLEQLPSDFRDIFILRLGIARVQVIIKNKHELKEVLNQLSPHSCMIFLGSLGSTYIKETLDDGYYLVPILKKEMPNHFKLQWLENLGGEYIQKMLKASDEHHKSLHEDIQKNTPDVAALICDILRSIPAKSRVSFLRDTLGVALIYNYFKDTTRSHLLFDSCFPTEIQIELIKVLGAQWVRKMNLSMLLKGFPRASWDEFFKILGTDWVTPENFAGLLNSPSLGKWSQFFADFGISRVQAFLKEPKVFAALINELSDDEYCFKLLSALKDANIQIPIHYAYQLGEILAWLKEDKKIVFLNALDEAGIQINIQNYLQLAAILKPLSRKPRREYIQMLDQKNLLSEIIQSEAQLSGLLLLFPTEEEQIDLMEDFSTDFIQKKIHDIDQLISVLEKFSEDNQAKILDWLSKHLRVIVCYKENYEESSLAFLQLIQRQFISQFNKSYNDTDRAWDFLLHYEALLQRAISYIYHIIPEHLNTMLDFLVDSQSLFNFDMFSFQARGDIQNMSHAMRLMRIASTEELDSEKVRLFWDNFSNPMGPHFIHAWQNVLGKWLHMFNLWLTMENYVRVLEMLLNHPKETFVQVFWNVCCQKNDNTNVWRMLLLCELSEDARQIFIARFGQETIQAMFFNYMDLALLLSNISENAWDVCVDMFGIDYIQKIAQGHLLILLNSLHVSQWSLLMKHLEVAFLKKNIKNGDGLAQILIFLNNHHFDFLEELKKKLPLNDFQSLVADPVSAPDIIIRKIFKAENSNVDYQRSLKSRLFQDPPLKESKKQVLKVLKLYQNVSNWTPALYFNGVDNSPEEINFVKKLYDAMLTAKEGISIETAFVHAFSKAMQNAPVEIVHGQRLFAYMQYVTMELNLKANYQSHNGKFVLLGVWVDQEVIAQPCAPSASATFSP